MMLKNKLSKGKPYELNFETVPNGGWLSEQMRIDYLMGYEKLVPEQFQPNITKLEEEGEHVPRDIVLDTFTFEEDPKLEVDALTEEQLRELEREIEEEEPQFENKNPDDIKEEL